MSIFQVLNKLVRFVLCMFLLQRTILFE